MCVTWENFFLFAQIQLLKHYMYHPIDYTCPSCGTRGLKLFHQVKNVPVHSCVLLDSAQQAREFPVGELALALCEQCGFITNTAFDGTVQNYAPGYEDQQCFSPTFQAFAQDLAERLIKKYDLFDKDIVEIGCGKGDFLQLLCELGNNRGVGVDPAWDRNRLKRSATAPIVFIQDYYSERYAHQGGEFICCRHTLEHIHAPAAFVATVRRGIGAHADTVVFFEVPETMRVLRELAFWDMYYEHCSYFTPGSLARLFQSCGLEVTELAKDYGDQYLIIEARRANGRPREIPAVAESPAQVIEAVKSFAENCSREMANWRERIGRFVDQGERIAIWGSGSKCVAFMTTLGLMDEIGCVVDINPHRHGKFIPGAAKQIMPPAYLKEFAPDVVIAMNPIYREEIAKQIEQMEITAELLTV